MDVGQLRHHADRAEDGEGRGKDPIADAGHHVAAAGRHLVNAHGQRHAGLADARQLRGRQAVAMDHATAAFQAQHHLVVLARHAQHRSHFVTQLLGSRGLDVAVEIEHVDPRLLFRMFLRLLRRLALLLAQGLEAGLVEDAVADPLAQVLVEIVELLHVEVPACAAPAAAAQGDDHHQHHDDRRQHGHGPGQKARIFGNELHTTPSLLLTHPSTGDTIAQAYPGHRRAASDATAWKAFAGRARSSR